MTKSGSQVNMRKTICVKVYKSATKSVHYLWHRGKVSSKKSFYPCQDRLTDGQTCHVVHFLKFLSKLPKKIRKASDPKWHLRFKGSAPTWRSRKMMLVPQAWVTRMWRLIFIIFFRFFRFASPGDEKKKCIKKKKWILLLCHTLLVFLAPSEQRQALCLTGQGIEIIWVYDRLLSSWGGGGGGRVSMFGIIRKRCI